MCPENATKGIGMSAGTLLLLQLVVIVLVYLVLGLGYKRFVLGARGAEQIPNLSMWKNVSVTYPTRCYYRCYRCYCRVSYYRCYCYLAFLVTSLIIRLTSNITSVVMVTLVILLVLSW